MNIRLRLQQLELQVGRLGTDNSTQMVHEAMGRVLTSPQGHEVGSSLGERLNDLGMLGDPQAMRATIEDDAQVREEVLYLGNLLAALRYTGRRHPDPSTTP